VLGKLAFFELATGSVLRTVDLGYHPDAVKFTPDGTKVIVANEGEYTAGAAQAPGSVSVVDVAAVTSAASLTTVTLSVTTVDFNTGLAAGVNLNNVRINVAGVAAADRYLYIEPEFSAPTNDKVYVTLQENNAIAILDLTGPNANKFTAINYLGTILQRIDASDQDPTGGGLAAININDVVPGLPMPDTIQTFVKGGRRLMATANEGDARTDDGDIARAIATIRYVDNRGEPTETYPLNPNGSAGGFNGYTTEDGRFTIVMPHPERVFRSVQQSWAMPGAGEDGAWMRMFRNARKWLG
jgi:hypothetical protein